MKTAAQTVGAVVLFFYAMSWLGLVDFNLCIGKPGSCVQQPVVKPLGAA